MARRIAAAMSLLVFAVCLAAGAEAGNPLATTLSRALLAMGGTLLVGLIVGAMVEKMLQEHLAAHKAGLAQASEGTTSEPDGIPTSGAEPGALRQPRA